MQSLLVNEYVQKVTGDGDGRQLVKIVRMGLVRIVLIVVQGCGGRSTTAADHGFDGTKEEVAATSLANALTLYSILLGGKGKKYLSGGT